MALKICLLLLACAAVGLAQILGNVPGPELGPIYTLQTFIDPNLNMDDRDAIEERINLTEAIRIDNPEVHYEWENYDGWYNNPAHPEWGGAGKLHCAEIYVNQCTMQMCMQLSCIFFCIIFNFVVFAKLSYC